MTPDRVRGGPGRASAPAGRNVLAHFDQEKGEFERKKTRTSPHRGKWLREALGTQGGGVGGCGGQKKRWKLRTEYLQKAGQSPVSRKSVVCLLLTLTVWFVSKRISTLSSAAAGDSPDYLLKLSAEMKRKSFLETFFSHYNGDPYVHGGSVNTSNATWAMLRK